MPDFGKHFDERVEQMRASRGRSPLMTEPNSKEGQEVCKHDWKLPVNSMAHSYDLLNNTGLNPKTDERLWWCRLCGAISWRGLDTAALEGRKAADEWKEKYEQERHFKRNANLALGDEAMAKLRLEERIRELEAAVRALLAHVGNPNPAHTDKRTYVLKGHGKAWEDALLKLDTLLLTSSREGSTEEQGGNGA